MAQAFSYLRVSGKSQVDGDGFERQRDAIDRFAKANGYTLVEEFRDEGVSGTTDLEDRPALVELMKRVASNGVRVVIVERIDRLARLLMSQEATLAHFSKIGVRVLTADGLDLTADDDPSRTLIRQIFGAVAEWQKNTDVAKLAAARKRIRESGRTCDGRKRFGFREQEREIATRIKTLRAKRMTYEEIADRINSAGARTRQGKPWTPGNVYHVAQKPMALITAAATQTEMTA